MNKIFLALLLPFSGSLFAQCPVLAEQERPAFRITPHLEHGIEIAEIVLRKAELKKEIAQEEALAAEEHLAGLLAKAILEARKTKIDGSWHQNREAYQWQSQRHPDFEQVEIIEQRSGFSPNLRGDKERPFPPHCHRGNYREPEVFGGQKQPDNSQISEGLELNLNFSNMR